jgi:hypothetical protein
MSANTKVVVMAVMKILPIISFPWRTLTEDEPLCGVPVVSYFKKHLGRKM